MLIAIVNLEIFWEETKNPFDAGFFTYHSIVIFLNFC